VLEFLMLVASLGAADGAGTNPCAVIVDDSQRLACYDGLFRVPGPPASASSGPAETTAAPSAAAAAGATTVAAGTQENFGLTQQQLAERDGVDNRLEEIKAVVAEIHVSRVGKHAYSLDNGQRWRQTESSSRPLLKVGATVVIKRGSLGSFMAKMPDFGGQPAWVRREE